MRVDRAWPDKAATSRLDYDLLWDAWLSPGEHIQDSQWSATGGIEVSDASHMATSARVWLDGGAPGVQIIRNTITTTQGRRATAKVSLRVVS